MCVCSDWNFLWNKYLKSKRYLDKVQYNAIILNGRSVIILHVGATWRINQQHRGSSSTQTRKVPAPYRANVSQLTSTTNYKHILFSWQFVKYEWYIKFIDNANNLLFGIYKFGCNLWTNRTWSWLLNYKMCVRSFGYEV